MGQEAGVPVHLPFLRAAVDQPIHCWFWVRPKTSSHTNTVIMINVTTTSIIIIIFIIVNIVVLIDIIIV